MVQNLALISCGGSCKVRSFSQDTIQDFDSSVGAVLVLKRNLWISMGSNPCPNFYKRFWSSNLTNFMWRQM